MWKSLFHMQENVVLFYVWLFVIGIHTYTLALIFRLYKRAPIYTETKEFSQSTSHDGCCFWKRKMMEGCNIPGTSIWIWIPTLFKNEHCYCIHVYKLLMLFTVTIKNKNFSLWGTFRQDDSSPFQNTFWFAMHQANSKPLFWCFDNDYVLKTS